MAQSGWIGQKLGGRYEIETLLGEGGMASVYKANDPNLRRVVAVKLIHPHLSRDPEFVRRFEAEASAVAQMRHPHVIQVFDYASDQDVFYIVFEFVAGVSLQEHLARLSADGRRMSFEEAAKVGRDIASALKYAHERGLIHRDVKPANVMLNFNGDGILMDFGIVKIAGGTQ
ncbi:MAG: serine/threonine protein kinase, partial [Gammaproteobacteria bacterium]|nr:serine/threonine protein kinase [Gammaproteobacteria bacterium]NIW48037.1 protein kinase [Gammaproteobacteria bacterium]